MNLATVFDLAAALAGLASSIFFAVGVLHVKDSTLGTIAVSQWGKGKAIAIELSQQKTDFTFGGWLLLFSFLIQFASKALPRETAEISVTTSPLVGVAISFSIPTVALCLIYFPWRHYRKKSVLRIEALTKNQG